MPNVSITLASNPGLCERSRSLLACAVNELGALHSSQSGITQ
jgi:hypothetical protein